MRPAPSSRDQSTAVQGNPTTRAIAPFEQSAVRQSPDPGKAAATALWIAELHLSACRRWLACDPARCSEVAASMLGILDALAETAPEASPIFEPSLAVLRPNGLFLDRAECLEALARVEGLMLDLKAQQERSEA